MSTISSHFKWAFLGNGYFAREVLSELYFSRFIPDLVITTKDKPAGRGLKPRPNPVKDFILNTTINILEVEKINKPETIEQISEKGFTFFVVCDFGKILKEPYLKIAKYPTINIHPSLLPLYRGAAPVERALLDGAKTTGVTIIEMAMEVDSGPILDQVEISIEDEDTKGSLFQKLAKEVPDMLKKVFQAYLMESIKKIPQSENFTYAPKIKKEELLIDWSLSAQKIHNQVRAFSPLPGARTYLDEELIKIFRTKVEEVNLDLAVGEIKTNFHHLYVGTGSGIIEVLELQPAGKRIMSAKDFLAGRDVNGKKFGTKEVLK